jgi:hypothetical protein
VGSDLESIHLIAQHVSIVIGLQQIQFDLKLGEVRQGCCKHQLAPPLDPVDGRCVKLSLDQLWGQGQGQHHC